MKHGRGLQCHEATPHMMEWQRHPDSVLSFKIRLNVVLITMVPSILFPYLIHARIRLWILGFQKCKCHRNLCCYWVRYFFPLQHMGIYYLLQLLWLFIVNLEHFCVFYSYSGLHWNDIMQSLFLLTPFTMGTSSVTIRWSSYFILFCPTSMHHFLYGELTCPFLQYGNYFIVTSFTFGSISSLL